MLGKEQGSSKQTNKRKDPNANHFMPSKKKKNHRNTQYNNNTLI